MSSARDDVRAYWEGGAFVAFNSYVEHVLKVMDDTAEVMRSMSKLNLDVLETTVNTYNSGINFIGECAQALLSAAASVAQNLLNLVGATCSAILEALSKFVGAVTELMIARNRSMMGYAKTGIALKQAAINLRVPDPIPSSVGDSGNWKVGRR
ncbi:hypothetical protein SAMN04489726_7864 [Allokutzneria albata]|uniref:Uncharacterized protein n=2 Tax=Allokutzneria albata TaxID=211114 RepID=A0A1H0DKM7_ALLAB|nr:hypothetical protein SAMN04489726_7864 [Allokutzneria albata]